MAEELLLKRVSSSLVPIEPISHETLQKIGLNETVTATIRRTRNIQHHKLFWALIGLIFNNQTRYATRVQLVNAVKIGVGLYDEQLVRINGIEVTVYVPRSISFASMDQSEFSQFFDKAMEYVITEIVPGLNKEDLQREILTML